MNVGLSEGAALARNLRKMLRDRAPAGVLETYDRERQQEWQQLLGLKGGLKPRSDTDAWVSQRRSRILPCLPASNADLSRLAAQLRVDI